MDLKRVLMSPHKLISALVTAIKHVCRVGTLSEMILGTCMVQSCVSVSTLFFLSYDLLRYSFSNDDRSNGDQACAITVGVLRGTIASTSW